MNASPRAPTVSTRFEGTIHDFGVLNALAGLPTTKVAIRQVADSIRYHIDQREQVGQ